MNPDQEMLRMTALQIISPSRRTLEDSREYARLKPGPAGSATGSMPGLFRALRNKRD